MSANISTSQGVAEVFVAGAPAWHNLGVNVEKAQKWEDAIKLAHLDWSISKKQFTNPVDGALVPSFALVRDDTGKYLSTVGTGYTPIQNADCFEWLDALMETREAHFESAGALGNGEVVWALARLDKKFEPIKGDRHNTYLLFTDRRDGKAGTCKMCMTRVVCNNTLQAALGEDTGDQVLRLRHTSGVKDKLQLAKGLIKGVSAQIESMNDKLKRLAEIKVTKTSYATVMGTLFPELETSARQQNMAALVAMNFSSNDQNAIPAAAGTMYGLLNGVTQWVDHQRDGFRTGDAGAAAMPYRRAEAALFGSGDDIKVAALEAILAAVNLNDKPSAVPAVNADRVKNILAMVNA